MTVHPAGHDLQTAPGPAPLLLGPGTDSTATIMDRVRLAEDVGLERLWLDQMPGVHDAGVVAAACLAATERMTVGTAVLPVTARHPVAMGQLATGLAAMSGGRFTLGVGAGHPFVNEFVLGLPPSPPLAATREYLSVLRSYLRDGRVDFAGEHYSAHASNETPEGPDIPVFLGAVRPGMIRLAVEQADGLLLWLAPPRYVAEHVLPVVREACAEIGRDPATLPVYAIVSAYLADDHPDAYAGLEVMITRYAMMPAYRHIMEASGHRERLAAGDIDRAMIDDLVIVGDADDAAARLAAYREAGCTPVIAAALGSGVLQIDGADAFARFVKAVSVG
ncbi:LLM class flavin-dependent oxidoreductase [Actinomadura fibrosa]|uniref:LLM class flavin-dependent oxidoreductase n=1 Tax=Actinomadura fibrosa TaxID=111802 RepID=A0ABW2XQA8_9ACTN|nr:LLM class flavin-dependent oxidoreductase [Actinomadura fibrosa]